MMDTGWAEKEQEDTGTQICRELMEKLDEFYTSGKYIAAICAAPSILDTEVI